MTSTLRMFVIGVTLILGVIILVLSLLLTRDFFINVPPRPNLSTSTDPGEQDVKKKEIENYEKLVTTMRSGTTGMYDWVVTKTLLPIFNSLLTAIIAYVFAKEGSKVLIAYFRSRGGR